jgi:hypothetical protein
MQGYQVHSCELKKWFVPFFQDLWNFLTKPISQSLLLRSWSPVLKFGSMHVVLHNTVSWETELIFFIWFRDPLNKSFQGPLVCCPLSAPTTGLLLAPTEIKPVSTFFLYTLWALEKFCSVKYRHKNSLAQSSYVMSLVLKASGKIP